MTDSKAIAFVHKYIFYLSPNLYDHRMDELGISIITLILEISKADNIIDIDYVDVSHLLTIMKQEIETDHEIDVAVKEYVVQFLRRFKQPRYGILYLGILNDILWSLKND